MKSILTILCFVLSGIAIGGETLDATAGVSGTLSLTSGGTQVTDFGTGLFDEHWGSAQVSGSDPKKLSLKTKAGAVIKVDASSERSDAGTIKTAFTFTPENDVKLNALCVSAEFPTASLSGTTWTLDAETGTFPAEHAQAMVRAGMAKKIVLRPKGAGEIRITLDSSTYVLLQDNRQWNTSTFSLRIGSGGSFKKGQAVKLGYELSSAAPIALVKDGPVTIVAGADWIPLKTELDIEAGSALDFSGMGFTDAPAGKHGRVICRADGEFVFENDQKTPRRFYGVNLCFGAQFLTHEESDKLAERFSRIGYNAVRIHHYEGQLTKGKPSTEFNEESIDQLDYLFAAMGKRGIYITTDLFVSRPVKYKDIGIDKPGNVGMDEFKILVGAHPGAYENWKKFSKNFLEHTNKYTGKRHADDPALAWLAMINEGNFGNFTGMMKNVPEWKTAWNDWLKKKYTDRAALAKEWGGALKADEDATNGSVATPMNVRGGNARARDENVFLGEMERDMVVKMTEFLRKDIGCKALISNTSAWTNHATDQLKRTTYDYIDDHFYVDHPQFLQGDWRLPSRCPNTSPIAGGAAGGRTCAFTRIFGKPFTITEFNFSGPGRFRGVGGILTGAMGALQGWNGIWRFAYAHDKSYMFAPGRINYFDMACDPLGLAAERASLCLFMRGDMKTASHAAIIAMEENELKNPASKVPDLAASWHWAAWVTKIGTKVVADVSKLEASPNEILFPLGWKTGATGMKAYDAKGADVLSVLNKGGVIGTDNKTDPAKNIFVSETGEITIDAPADKMILDTPRTAGGYAKAGTGIVTRDGGVSIDVLGADATVWISAVDAEPIAKSKRLIVTHLTDLQNTEIKYAENARKTLLDWGKLPHLVRNGKAAIKVKLISPENYEVFALATSGKRLGKVETTVKGSVLEFLTDVNGRPDEGARMLYEIVAK